MVLSLIEEHFPNFLKIYNSYDVQIKKHDAARIAILYVFGGIYLDHDFIAIKNIEQALGTCEFVIGSENSQMNPVNSIIATVKNNPLMAMIIDLMNNEDVSKQYVLDATGPHMLLNGLKKFLETGGK